MRIPSLVLWRSTNVCAHWSRRRAVAVIVQKHLASHTAASGPSGVLQLVPIATPAGATVSAAREWRLAVDHGVRQRQRAHLRDWYSRGGARPTRRMLEARLTCGQVLKVANFRIIHMVKFRLLLLRCICGRYRRHSLALEIAKAAGVLNRRFPKLFPAHLAPHAAPAHRPAA